MWIAPPSGLRLRSATTTASVDFATWSRTRADAAPWPPLTARNAFVIAIEIFAGSKPTTAPLRRITLNCAKRGSVPATVPPVSPTIRSRGGVAVGEGDVVTMRMRELLVLALSLPASPPAHVFVVAPEAPRGMPAPQWTSVDPARNRRCRGPFAADRSRSNPLYVVPHVCFRHQA